MVFMRFLATLLVVAAAAPRVFPLPLDQGHDGTVFNPSLVDLPSLAQDVINASLLQIDREYKFSKHFRLDAPFSIALHANESVLVPLKPIHDQLFPQASNIDLTKLAIAFELTTCQGNVLTYIATHDDKLRRFSSAPYQCATIAKAHDPQQLSLCPLVHDDSGLVWRLDPTTVKGFVLRAKIGQPADVVALLRSTKQHGAYKKAFFTADPDAPALHVNVTYGENSTELAFDTPVTWTPPSSTGNATTGFCETCVYELYAEMMPPANDSVIAATQSAEVPLPYCLRRDRSVTYKLPPTASSSNASSTQRVALDQYFADKFRTSGNYRVVLVASLPSSTNNGHPALVAYAATRVYVTAPTHYMSHFFVVLAVVATIAFLTFVTVKSELPHRIWRAHKMRAEKKDHQEDDESVRLLAQVIADQDAAADDGGSIEAANAENPRHHYSDAQDEVEEDGKPASLLDVIRKTKAQQATPTPSPRGAAPVLDGYHEIN